jgi:3-hydroxymyristoyl/3-hydroxydecanoyl-(acyl carrier protein) dehydratase
MSLPCPVADLIPQKGKMGFEQILFKTKDDDSESTAVIGDNIFLDDRRQLSNIALIEYVNQLNAAVSGYNGKHQKQPAKKGLFVGLEDVEFFQPVQRGDSLTLKAFVTEEVEPVTFIQGNIERNGERISHFVTKLYKFDDLQESASLINPSHAREILPPKNGLTLNQPQPPAYLSSEMQRKLYTYLRDPDPGTDIISFQIACPDDFEAFDGHFPGNPILPGIVLLEIGKLGLQLWTKQSVVITSLKKMKISNVVLPHQVISCALKIGPLSGARISFSAIFKGEEEQEISRFNGHFETV